MIIADVNLTREFMVDRLQLRSTPDFRGFMVVNDVYHGRIMDMNHIGVAVGWDNFIGRTCVINIVVQDQKMLSRRVVRECFEFPFLKAGCNAVLAMVDSNNTKSIKLCERSGFEKVHLIPAGGVESDLIVFQMLRTKCRWLRMH
jgi:hypothetical protein